MRAHSKNEKDVLEEITTVSSKRRDTEEPSEAADRRCNSEKVSTASVGEFLGARDIVEQACASKVQATGTFVGESSSMRNECTEKGVVRVQHTRHKFLNTGE